MGFGKALKRMGAAVQDVTKQSGAAYQEAATKVGKANKKYNPAYGTKVGLLARARAAKGMIRPSEE